MQKQPALQPATVARTRLRTVYEQFPNHSLESPTEVEDSNPKPGTCKDPTVDKTYLEYAPRTPVGRKHAPNPEPDASDSQPEKCRVVKDKEPTEGSSYTRAWLTPSSEPLTERECMKPAGDTDSPCPPCTSRREAGQRSRDV